jgi:hypothetical protein
MNHEVFLINPAASPDGAYLVEGITNGDPDGKEARQEA